MHAALLAVVVKEALHGDLDGLDLDAGQARHDLRDFQQLFAREAAQHGRGGLLAHAQQHDGGLLDRAGGQVLQLQVGGISRLWHFW